MSNKIGTSAIKLRGGDTVFYALGNAGQVMLVNPAEHAVVVKWAVWAAPAKYEERHQQDQAFFAALFETMSGDG